MTLTRREFVQLAAAIGASLAWGGSARASTAAWHERRDLFPEGVASGDPDPNSVILWTRRPFESGGRRVLTVEVAEDEAFRRVVANAPAPVSAARTGRRACWSADSSRRAPTGIASPTQTGTAAASAGRSPRRWPTIHAPVNFAFVSCQNVNEGKLNAYRRMIYEDERAAPADQLDFVLHLGDFIYEVVQYPEELKTRYDRTIYEVCAHPRWRQGRQLPHPADRRRLSRHLQRLSRRSRPPGRARALAVRRHLGQPRILVAGLAEHRQGGGDRAAGPDRQGRREPGLVRIPPRACHGAERIARDVRPARREGMCRSRSSTTTAWGSNRTT